MDDRTTNPVRKGSLNTPGTESKTVEESLRTEGVRQLIRHGTEGRVRGPRDRIYSRDKIEESHESSWTLLS